MAGKNKVTLTFAGDSKDLERAFDRVDDKAGGMDRKFRDKGGMFDGFADAGGEAAAGFGASFSSKIGPLMAKLPISGPMGAVLVGAAAAAAPLVGAALVAGILLALGGGVLVAGIISAVKDPAVSGAFGQVGDRAKKAFAGFGEPFKAPLIRAAKLFGDAIERMAPAFKRMGQAIAPLIDRLAPALVQIAERSMPGIEKAVAASVPLFEKIAEHAPEIGDAISKFFEAIADGAPGAIKFIQILLDIFEFMLPFIGGTLKFLSGEFKKSMDAWAFGFKLVGRAWDRLGDLFGTISRRVASVWNWLTGNATRLRGALRDRFNDVVSFMRGIPGRIGSALSAVAGRILSPFRSGFNAIARAWNNTVGRLHWSVPGFLGFGGFTISAPNLPTFHQGGVVPGTPGKEVLAILQAGERVTPAGRSGDLPTIVIRSGGSRLDDLLVSMLRDAIQIRGGNVQVVLGVGGA